MKKLTKVLAFILCMAMMFALCACGGSDTEKFVGTWEAEFDMTDALLEGMEEGLGDDVAFFEFDKLITTVTYILKDDGTYEITMVLSEESVENFYSAYEAGLRAYMDAALEEELAASGLSMEEFDAQFAEYAGMSYAEYVDLSIEEAMGGMDIQDMFPDSIMEGKWKAEAGKLFMTEDLDEDFEEGSYDIYEDLTADSFTLVEGFTDAEEDDSGFYPITFTRVK